MPTDAIVWFLLHTFVLCSSSTGNGRAMQYYWSEVQATMCSCLPPSLPLLQFSWTHITLFMFGCPAYLIIQNTFESIFWFLVPVSMVVCNDIMAYLFGRPCSAS